MVTSEKSHGHRCLLYPAHHHTPSLAKYIIILLVPLLQTKKICEHLIITSVSFLNKRYHSILCSASCVFFFFFFPFSSTPLKSLHMCSWRISLVFFQSCLLLVMCLFPIGGRPGSSYLCSSQVEPQRKTPCENEVKDGLLLQNWEPL